MLFDILDALVDIRSGVAGNLCLRHAARKVQHHIVLQLINCFRILEFFTFLNVDVAELVGGFDVKPPFNCIAGNQCDCRDKDIFRLTYGIV